MEIQKISQMRRILPDTLKGLYASKGDALTIARRKCEEDCVTAAKALLPDSSKAIGRRYEEMENYEKGVVEIRVEHFYRIQKGGENEGGGVESH